MTVLEMRAEALARATGGLSMTNWPAIFAGFLEKGIPEADIRPRENVLTFNAWKALGRHVRKGEHGVRVVTYVQIQERAEAKEPQAEGAEPKARKVARRPRSAVVFHVSQTEAD